MFSGRNQQSLISRQYPAIIVGLTLVICAAGSGCNLSVNFGQHGPTPFPVAPPGVPRELDKVSLPSYIIEPPDILRVEALKTLPDRFLPAECLVRPDGTINLGLYGNVRVAGLTLEQARVALEAHLSEFIKEPKIYVDVLAYNSKAYYVIADGGGFGEQVTRLPFTGNETVLDGISQIGGLPTVSSKKAIWLARPSPTGKGGDLVMPVDWLAITQRGNAATNYQVLPGDRIYIASDGWIFADSMMAKIFAPFERMFGVTLLSATTINRLQNMGRGAGGFGGGGGGGGGF